LASSLSPHFSQPMHAWSSPTSRFAAIESSHGRRPCGASAEQGKPVGSDVEKHPEPRQGRLRTRAVQVQSPLAGLRSCWGPSSPRAGPPLTGLWTHASAPTQANPDACPKTRIPTAHPASLTPGVRNAPFWLRLQRLAPLPLRVSPERSRREQSACAPRRIHRATSCGGGGFRSSRVRLARIRDSFIP